MSLILYLSFVASLVTMGLAQAKTPPAFSAAQLGKIRANAVKSSLKSWEIGALLEALLQVDSPQLSVFGAAAVPATPSSKARFPTAGVSALDDILANRWNGLEAFFKDGSSGDPASVGVANTILGLITNESKYTDASESQLNWLLHNVPRAADNLTLSHRQDQFQAWSDYMFMGPPFLAYEATVKGGDEGAGLAWFAHQQAVGYRRLLRDPDTKLWRHIAEGSFSDGGLWATGNGWAAMGMLRVEETIAKSEFAGNMRSEIADLRAWTSEILNGTWTAQEPSGLVNNYMHADSFEDAAGTALLVASTYRYSLITHTDTYIPFAEKAFKRLIELVDSNGWLTSVTDPYKFRVPGEKSPEAESFLLLVHAAARDYYGWKDSPSNVLSNALLHGLSRVEAARRA